MWCSLLKDKKVMKGSINRTGDMNSTSCQIGERSARIKFENDFFIWLAVTNILIKRSLIIRSHASINSGNDLKI